MFIVPLSLLFIAGFVLSVEGLCGDSIRWAHHFNVDDVYGMWYGVGYAQHTPDMTNKPNVVGCITIHVTDVTTEHRDDLLDWSIQRHNYSDEKWRSHKSHPWSKNPMSGSWLDVRLKRDIYNERRLRVVWDEDGQSVEQSYVYTPNEPGFWVAEQRNTLEREMEARGIDMWYPDDPPRHPQVIRILNVTSHLMIMNHCSDVGGGVFSLILRRSPSRVDRWDWYEYKKLFFNFDLPNMYRYTTICAGCAKSSSLLFTLMCIIIYILL